MNQDRIPINIQDLNDMMDNDHVLIRECFEDFSREYPKSLENIGSAIDGNDARALERAAHGFKGTLRYLAAKTAADLSYQLEMMGKKGDLDGARKVYESLSVECGNILVFVKSY